MKIFNWVHKRLFHPKVVNDTSLASSDVHKIDEPAINEADTQALLKQVAVVDVLGGWNNAILAIGTLGFDHTLKPFNHQQGYLTLERDMEEDQTDEDDDVDKYNVGGEELNPLMCATSDDNFSGTVEPAAVSDIAAADAVAIKHGIFSVTASDQLSSDQLSSDHQVSSNRKKGDRITLADLFLADSVEIDSKTVDQTKTMLDARKELLSLKKKHRLSFTKKIISQVTDDSRPLKNLQRVMRRMLKRKVYPDFEVKNVKSDEAAGCSVKHKREASDSASLLPCQGASV